MEKTIMRILKLSVLFSTAVALSLPTLFAVAQSAPSDTQTSLKIADFVREDKFRSLSISPKGTYIAVTVPIEDKTILVVVKPGDPKPVSRIDVRGNKSHVVDVAWVSDDRLIYSVAVKDQLNEAPNDTGESWAINADGTKAVQLDGFKPTDANFSARAGGPSKRESVHVTMIDSLPEDDESIIVALYKSGSDYTTVERMNVKSGSRSRISQAPVPNAEFMTDNRGQVRFARGFGTDRFKKLYYRKSDEAKWELMDDEGVTGKNLEPIGFSVDDSVVYMVAGEKKGPDSIIAYDVVTGTSKTVVRDTISNHSAVINAIGKRHPIGVVYAGPNPRYEYFIPDSAEAKAHRALQRAFPGQVVLVGKDVTVKNEVLIYAYGDREPGAFYAMNLTTRNVTPVMYVADWMTPELLAPMRDVLFEARDGRKIPGWLTVPVGSDGKNLPMVVNPHGGPFDIQDTWGFDTTAQILASHGYAVLQVNFRGSGGYGRDHEIAGHKQWGLKMQDDLTDATRWAIAQGIADKSRICIYGASYGGYASLMGVAKEPDLYQCAVGQVGVYDLAMMKAEDSLGNDYIRNFFADTLNSSDLTSVSPNFQASKIKVPVFLSAGKEDKTAPIEHTEKMEAALKAAGVSVETLYFPTESHGIYKKENKIKFYTQLLTFLNKHIGGHAPQ
jgi:dipeptidyl aminopeptidase/acylaminoacyl peptidase